MRLRGANEEGSGTGNEDLKLYATLSRAPFPKSYLGKVFLAAFLGTHVPLLSLVVYLARDPRRIGSRVTGRILSVALLATLGGTAATLWAMSALSAPVTLASRALRRYLDRGEIPALPVGYPDRAGRLMTDVQYAVERLDAALRSLEELATTDHVTGVYNRRAAEERLAEDIARAQRKGGTLTLAALDLDNFKPINDEHGHRAGDACIKHFADFLGRNLRQGDWVGRWGGDEFVVGLWHAGEEAQPVERILARVAEEVREKPVVLPNGKEAYLTFSGGWADGSRGRTPRVCSPRRTKPSTGPRKGEGAPSYAPTSRGRVAAPLFGPFIHERRRRGVLGSSLAESCIAPVQTPHKRGDRHPGIGRTHAPCHVIG
jgi:diguanylate cyclase (GGDEF)-like protein